MFHDLVYYELRSKEMTKYEIEDYCVSQARCRRRSYILFRKVERIRNAKLVGFLKVCLLY